MIISVSRRTDIPAFYARWFIARVRAGYCLVTNPFNARQVARVSLLPRDVDVFVFWTRNPRPLFPYLDELTQRGYRYYFQVTLMDNPRALDPKTPPLAQALQTFQELAARIGQANVNPKIAHRNHLLALFGSEDVRRTRADDAAQCLLAMHHHLLPQ